MTEATVIAGQTSSVGSSALTPTVGTIIGTITDANGSPLKSAKVSAVPSQHVKTVTSLTNAEDKYSITVSERPAVHASLRRLLADR
jgi:hypothetical protein